MDRKSTADIVALTPLQEGMLFHYLREPGNSLYFEQLSLGICGRMDIEFFEKAWNVVIETNEMLRTVFRWKEMERPIQIILNEHKLSWKYDDLSDKDATEREKILEEIKARNRNQGFDLQEVPFRVNLIKVKEDEYELVISNYHILYDGWSNGIILKEFFNAYTDLLNRQTPVKPVKTSFKDFIQWMQNQDKTKQKQFWTGYLAGFEVPTRLPIKIKRKEAREIKSFGNYTVILKRTIKDQLEIFIKEQRVTLASFIFTTWGILLQRYCNTGDVIFGTTVSGRSAPIKGIQDMIGLFINTIPLRINSGIDEKVKDLLDQVNHTLSIREKFESTPLVDIKEYSQLENNVDLFDSFIVMENYPLDHDLMDKNSHLSLVVDSYSIVESTNYDLGISITVGEMIGFNFIYNLTSLEKSSILRLSTHFSNIIEYILIDSKSKMSGIDILSKKEKKQILFSFNDTCAQYPQNRKIHGLFTEQTGKTPDNIAVVSHESHEKLEGTGGSTPMPSPLYITYKELERKSNQLARHLKAMGVTADTIIGLILERSIEMVIGIFGILKADGAYLPIDPQYPKERTNYIITDSGVKILLTTGEQVEKGNSINNKIANCQLSIINWQPKEPIINYPERRFRPQVTCNLYRHLAYIIYTSGSTGIPKGVMIEHQSVVNRLNWMQRSYSIGVEDIILQKTPYTFDVSVWELFWWSMNGASVYLLGPGEEKDPAIICEVIEKNKVTTMHFVPSMLNAFLDYIEGMARSHDLGILRRLRQVFASGEALGVHQVKRFNGQLNKINGTVLVNLYGPTEATVDVSYFNCLPGEEENYESIPIGCPIENIQLYIINKNGGVQPIGVPGELYISGICLGRGYLNQSELTAEKFDHDLWDLQDYQDKEKKVTIKKYNKKLLRGDARKAQSTERHAPCAMRLPHGRRRQKIYKTGDLARWLPAGNIEFLGRIDHQVKVRGFRIELAEIENLLLKHEKIKGAVVIDIEDKVGDKNLAAYLVSDSKASILVPQLKEYLLEFLPDYMVPDYFMQIDEIPLTPSGKVDRRALPAPVITPGDRYAAPRDEIEKKLDKIWAETLGLESSIIGIQDNFFKLGGHSLKATTLALKIHKAFNVKLPLNEIFKRPTVEGLSGYIREAVKEQFISIEVTEKKECFPLSSAQKRLFYLQQANGTATVYNMPSAWILEGAVDKNRLGNTFKKLIQRHESLRTSFQTYGEEIVQQIHDDVKFELEAHQLLVNSHWLLVGKNSRSPLNCQIRCEVSLPVEIRTITREFIRFFDLSQAPLLRVRLIKLQHTPIALRGLPRQDTYKSQEGKEDKYLLMVDMHHTITDGISTEVLTQDFMDLYSGKKLPGMRLQYKDYAQWQNREKKTARVQKQAQYWKKQLEAEIPVIDLPVDYARPSVRCFEGSSLSFELNRDSTYALKSLALAEGTTLYMVLLALFNIFLSKLTNQEDIVIGTPAAGRRHADIEKIIGMFVNTLALRNYPAGEKTFAEFLIEIKKNTLKAFENQEYQYEALVEQVVKNRDISRNPIFDVSFVLQDTVISTIEIPGIKLTPLDYESHTAKFDLALEGWELADVLHFRFEYSTKLFKKETIERFVNYFRNIVSGIPGNRNRKISRLGIISEEEKRKLLVDFNDTAADYPKDQTIHELFENQVERTPDIIAVIGPEVGVWKQNVHLTFNRLNKASNQLACLLQEKGVQPDTIVGIMLERSLEMIIGILAILKASGAYMPIDLGYPEERVNYMLTESASKILATTQDLSKEFQLAIEIIYLTDAINRGHTLNLFSFRPSTLRSFHMYRSPAPATSLAYAIYTSGSTGRPKGVMIEHSSVVNRLNWMQRFYPIGKDDVILHKTPFTFDVSVWELFWWSMQGAAVFLLGPGEERDPGIICEAIEKNSITTMHFVPSMLNAFLEYIEARADLRKFPSLKQVFASGEALGANQVERFNRHLNKTNGTNLINLYGPTEATVDVSYFNCSPAEKHKTIPIGRPIDNTQLYIINKNGDVQPIGVPGELCISGICLGRGYLNQSELTAEKFDYDLWDLQDYHDKEKKVTIKKYNKKLLRGDARKAQSAERHAPCPMRLSHGRRRQKIYKTCDLARWLPAGNIEFLGRIDHQVKVRGFRIELGEIENQLLKNKSVKEAVVSAREDKNSEKYLCAYIVPHSANFSSPEMAETLKSHLLHVIPDYMVPSFFVLLDKIPLTSNGKVDRRALPGPTLERGRKYTAPRNWIEQTLVEMWSEILGIKEDVIGIQAHFFVLGGHSLKAVILANKIHKTFAVKVSLQELFQSPTITGMAHLIQKSKSDAFQEIEKQPEKMHYNLSYSQKRLWYIYKSEPNSGAFNIPAKITLYETVNEKVIREVLEQLVIRHESLRTSFIEIDEKPRQVIEPFNQSKLSFQIIDASHLDKKRREIMRTRLMWAEASYVFNLEVGPLFRAKLVKWAAQEYDFIFNIHHIISDGWSMEILKQEFFQYYSAQKEGKIFAVEPLRIQYKDYAAWQNQLLADETHMGQAKEFWKNYLSGTLPVLDLPHDFLPVQGGLSNKKSSAYCFVIGEEVRQGLQAYARSRHASLFMVLLAGFYILLSHITGQEDILLAIPAAARQHWELKSIVGMFVNTLLLRSQISMDETFNDFFLSLQTNTFDVLEYQAYPLELIFSELKMKYPEISVFFNMLNFGTSQMEQLTDLMSYHIEETQETKFKIQCYLTEYKNGIQFSCHYFRELFLPESVEKIMNLFVKILENISTNPDQKLKKYCISTNKKKVLGSLKKVLQKNTEEKVSSEFKISDDVKRSHQRLSEVNIMFLDYVEKNPACLKSSNFRGLDLNDNLFRLQPWPTFIDTKTSVQFQEAGIRLFTLVKQIPRLVFNCNLQKMSTYYKMPEEMLSLQIEGATDEHIENLLSRGDFLLSTEGLKCLEYNVTPSLGGWQIPIWEALYLKNPILRRFLKEYGITTRNRNLLALFLEHIIRCSLGKLSPHESALNIALAIKGYEVGVDQDSWMHSTGAYLRLLYNDILLQVDKSLTGQFILCNYKQLRLVDDCIFFEGKKIHGLTEAYNGVVSLEVMTAFKSGNLCLFNGPISHLLSNKLNLAVLSNPETNEGYTAEERKIIATLVPWTRKTIAGPTTYRGETINDLEHFMLSHQERLVLKPSSGYGGKGICVGNKTSPDQWEEAVKIVIQEENWVVQEFVETCPGVYQVGEGYDYHDMAWGFFVFGSQYTGAWVRVMPKVSNKGVINCHQGATVSVIFEVDQKVDF